MGALWKPFEDFVENHDGLSFDKPLFKWASPGRTRVAAIQNQKQPHDTRNVSMGKDLFWNAGGDADQPSSIWTSYRGRYIPSAALSTDGNITALVDGIYRASHNNYVGVHWNKGLVDIPEEIMRREERTSYTPAARDALALVITTSNANLPVTTFLVNSTFEFLRSSGTL